ncbi:conserved Plasmodium protein, unknown function [Plasmodium relictum]|uniref:CCZ1/INTU/HSP4 first Longin domain-containing protein n=1 Tax=Plasmodium relictum TaxID=85471 RepID=A0A1J1H4U2_PLARL|nr:conserved Plasmodium protein, unknown function [Plasmodium relictum]CRG99948.1 conserved Plasmodium protein, unknown function [Plasmodium relictum]
MDKTKVEAFFIYDEDIKKTDKSMTDEQLQAEKVIYYYPNETEENIKVSHTSTMEGISTFVNQFSKSHLDHIVTNNNLIVINKWYKHIFVAIIVKNIYKNNKMELLMCRLLHSILNNFISIFTLLHGHIRNFLKYKKFKTVESKNKKKEVLQTLLDDYVFTYINTIKNENISIHNELQSFHFFPIEKHTYVSIQNLISSLILDHKQIKHGGLFYEGYLIYSSLPVDDIKIIYNYLVSYNGTVNNLKLSQYPFKKIASSAAINANGGLSSFARCNSVDEKNCFLLGIKKSSVFMPIITLSGEKKYKLVVFIYKEILLMLLIKGCTIKDEDFDTLIDVQNKCTSETSNNIYNLLRLNDNLSKQFKKHVNQEDAIRFFYYNNSNNSIKYSSNNKKISNEETFIIADFHSLFNDSEIKYNNIKFNKSEYLKNNKKSNLSNELFNFENSIQSNLKKEENNKEKDKENNNDKINEQIGIQTQHSEIEELKKKVDDSQLQKDLLIKSQKTKNGSIDTQEKEDQNIKIQIENKTEKYNIEAIQKKEKTEKIENVNIKNEEKLESEHLENEDSKKIDQKTLEQPETDNIKKVEKKKLKLICNQELKKKLFEDNSDDVKIEKIFYKEANSPWIFGKKSLERELFIFPDETKMSLSKAQQEINKIIESNFSNIYI